jgi:hypothetical protein
MASELHNKITGVKKTLIPESITDLKDKDFSGKLLRDEESLAITRYDAYRISYLNQAQTEEDYHKRFNELRVKASLSDWREFLKPEYAVAD